MSQHRGGDVRNSLTYLSREALKVSYNKDCASLLPGTKEMLKGDPRPLLPLLHYATLNFSSHVAKRIASEGFVMSGCSDEGFVKIMMRMVRKVFGYTPRLTAAQFLRRTGFAEQKMLLVADVVRRCRELDARTRNELDKAKRRDEIRKNHAVSSVAMRLYPGAGHNDKTKTVAVSSSSSVKPKSKRRNPSREVKRSHRPPKMDSRKLLAYRNQLSDITRRSCVDEADDAVRTEPPRPTPRDVHVKRDVVHALRRIVDQFDSFRVDVNASLHDMEMRLRHIETSVTKSPSPVPEPRPLVPRARQTFTAPLLPTRSKINSNTPEKKPTTTILNASTVKPATSTIRTTDVPAKTSPSLPRQKVPIEQFLKSIQNRFEESSKLID